MLRARGFDDVLDPLGGFVVGVKDAGRIGIRHETQIQVGKVAIVDAGPVIASFADDANETICGVFQ
jgi:hypothetical protein